MTEAICVPPLDLLFRCKYVWLGLLLREEKANTLWQHKISAMRKTEALMVVSLWWPSAHDNSFIIFWVRGVSGSRASTM